LGKIANISLSSHAKLSVEVEKRDGGILGQIGWNLKMIICEEEELGEK